MWIRDEQFIRGEIPMTKFEIRALIMANMNIQIGDELLDIGAGTGSISIQAAKLGAKVVSIEREREGIELIKKNSEKHSVDIEILEGEAPDIIPDRKYDKVFIGGSGKQMEGILKKVLPLIEEGGIILGTFITLKNLNLFTNILKKQNLKKIDISLIQSSRVRTKVEMLLAENPIFIVRGEL